MTARRCLDCGGPVSTPVMVGHETFCSARCARAWSANPATCDYRYHGSLGSARCGMPANRHTGRCGQHEREAQA